MAGTQLAVPALLKILEGNCYERLLWRPVLSVLQWQEHDEVIDKANGVDYGLTASIWTRDLQLAYRVAERLEAGYLWINGSTRHFLGVPFGGFKHSGLGREESLEDLLSYTQTKASIRRFSDGEQDSLASSAKAAKSAEFGNLI